MKPTLPFAATVAAAVLIVGVGGYTLGASRAPSATATPAMSDMVGMPGMSSMPDAMSQMTDALSGKTGDAFDRAFIDEMILHHQGAVAMARMALANASHPELKQMATAIIDAQTREIGQMQTWRQAWFGAQQ